MYFDIVRLSNNNFLMMIITTCSIVTNSNYIDYFYLSYSFNCI